MHELLWPDGVKSEIYRRMTLQSGDNCMGSRKFWEERFKEGRKSVVDDARPETPLSDICTED
jgi:hypothetical protein